LARDEKRKAVLNIGIAALAEAATADVSLLSPLLKLCQNFPQIPEYAPSGVAQCVEAFAANPDIQEHDADFWSLWELAWQKAVDAADAEPTGREIPDVCSTGGRLCEALFARLGSSPLKRGDGFPAGLAPRFDEVANGCSDAHRDARVVLAMRLLFLYAIAPDWTRVNLIDRMHPDRGREEASRLWRGYLLNPRYEVSLLEALKPCLLALLGQKDSIPEPRTLFSLFADMLLHLKTSFSNNEVNRAFDAMAPEGLAACLSQWRRTLEHVGDKAAELWTGSVQPLIEHHWPGARDKVTEKTSEEMTRLLLATREAFPQALSLVQGRRLLQAMPLARTTYLIMLLERPHQGQQNDSTYDYVERHAAEVLTLLHGIIARNSPAPDELDEVLQRIARLDPALCNRREYRELRDLASHG
jgi:hypothetical protein